MNFMGEADPSDTKIFVICNNKIIKTISLLDVLTIGRSTSNTLVLTDELVSRNHALIRRENKDYYVVDQGSANGTFLNGQPAATAKKMNNGDEIRLGKTILQFYHHQLKTGNTKRESTITDPTAVVFAPVTLSLLVTDIRNYTVLSEQIPATELSPIISEWFTIAGQHIINRGGTIEQFRGDCVAAYWLSNSTDNDNNYIIQAVKSASDLIAEARIIDETMSTRFPGKHFHIGCGVHTGEAVLGNIGLDARRDFTMLGDAVNITFRIEALCSLLGKEILVSGDIKKAVDGTFAFVDMGLNDLKGKSEQIRIYTLA